MEVVLIMFRPDGTRRAFPLTKSETTLGRREDCDFRIPLADVSRKHCRIIRDQEYVRLEDLGSANGTLVNGDRTQVIVLKPGDVITIGPVHFVLQIDGIPADSEVELPGPKPPSREADLSNKPFDPDDIGQILADDAANESGGFNFGDSSLSDNR